MSKQIVTHAKCPECGSVNLVRDIEMGESICSDCGLVIREIILDRGEEWIFVIFAVISTLRVLSY